VIWTKFYFRPSEFYRTFLQEYSVTNKNQLERVSPRIKILRDLEVRQIKVLVEIGGLFVSVLTTDGDGFFKGNENPQCSFRWRGSKAVGPLLKNPSKYERDTS
jgi:hypothetical protein